MRRKEVIICIEQNEKYNNPRFEECKCSAHPNGHMVQTSPGNSYRVWVKGNKKLWEADKNRYVALATLVKRVTSQHNMSVIGVEEAKGYNLPED